MIQRLLLLLPLTILIACAGDRAEKPSPSLYYWKTTFDFTTDDSALLAQNKVDRMYVRFFDLNSDWGNPIAPEARLKNQTPFPPNMEIIPVVYITNNCWKQSERNRPGNIREIARKTWAKISRMHNRYSSTELKEIQFDCDWTESTRFQFFEFLTHFREFCGTVQISSTIRLYQYKYFEKAGVPPVDKGVLMYYNMSDLKDPQTRNYILDHKKGKEYLMPSGYYPLELDIALPIYRQGVLYDEKNQIVRLTRDEEVANFKSENNSKPISNSTYTITAPYHYEENPPIWTLRHEFVSTTELTEAAYDLRKSFPNSRFIFFDYQENYIRQYPRSIYHEL
jgi:hypothetical protein